MWLNYFLDDPNFDYMTKCLKKHCFKLSEATNTWGVFPRCVELGRAIVYFEIALTLGLKPQASTNLHIIFRSHDRMLAAFFILFIAYNFTSVWDQ
jgi:hypothetical protein